MALGLVIAGLAFIFGILLTLFAGRILIYWYGLGFWITRKLSDVKVIKISEEDAMELFLKSRIHTVILWLFRATGIEISFTALYIFILMIIDY